jgi:hypothetical protein
MSGALETKEMLIAVNKLGVLICSLVADGIQFSDLPTLINELMVNKELKDSIAKAIENASKIPSELSNSDIIDKLGLAQVMISFIPQYLDAFKKK